MTKFSAKNPQLYNVLLQLTQLVLKNIADEIPNNLRATNESIWIKRDDGIYAKEQIRRIIWSFATDKAIDKLSDSNEYLDFIKIVSEDKDIAPQLNTLVGCCIGKMRLEAKYIILWLVNGFLSNDKIEDFDIGKYDIAYSKMEDEFYSTEIEFEKITPICGLNITTPEIKLSDDISIVKLRDSEILHFFNLGIKLGYDLGNQEFIHKVNEYAIKIRFKLPKVVGEQQYNIPDKYNDYFTNKNEQAVVDALRIYKNGEIYPIATLMKSKSRLASATQYNFEAHVKPFMDSTYKFEADEINDFVALWKESRKAHVFSIGVSRFSQSATRTNNEDRMIDLMIAAEAIFLTDDTSEMTYRLSHRAALFLADKIEEQKNIFSFMKSAYGIRSKIVHGNKPALPKKVDGSTLTLAEVCNTLEQYLRQAIKKLISENGSKKIDWDSIIFSSVGKK